MMHNQIASATTGHCESEVMTSFPRSSMLHLIRYIGQSTIYFCAIYWETKLIKLLNGIIIIKLGHNRSKLDGHDANVSERTRPLFSI